MKYRMKENMPAEDGGLLRSDLVFRTWRRGRGAWHWGGVGGGGGCYEGDDRREEAWPVGTPGPVQQQQPWTLGSSDRKSCQERLTVLICHVSVKQLSLAVAVLCFKFDGRFRSFLLLWNTFRNRNYPSLKKWRGQRKRSWQKFNDKS